VHRSNAHAVTPDGVSRAVVRSLPEPGSGSDFAIEIHPALF